MRIFESLKCTLCKKPFARVANQPRSPRRLLCGFVMCGECFQKEKARVENEREHQCNYNAICFNNPSFAYFIIDILSQEDALTIVPLEGGYVLSKPFKIPECAICHDEYSSHVEAKKSFVLNCNHIICTECYLKSRKAANPFSPFPIREKSNSLSTYFIACPTCRVQTSSTDDKAKDRFHDFLDELPTMVYQLDSMLKASACAECNKKYIIDEMFHCLKCSSEICGTCAYKKHHGHGAIPVLEEKANETFEKLRGASTNLIKTYKDLIPELHTEILNDVNTFETKLLSQEETIKNASTFVDLQVKNELFSKLQAGFEKIFEEYLPHLRRVGTELKRSIQTLHENAAVLEDEAVAKKYKLTM